MLAAALPQCPSITSINLRSNLIGVEGYKVLAAALPQCPSITSIGLEYNNISYHEESFLVIESVVNRNMRWFRRRFLLLVSVRYIQLLKLEDDAGTNASCDDYLFYASDLSTNQDVISDKSTSRRTVRRIFLLVFSDTNLVKYVAQYL